MYPDIDELNEDSYEPLSDEHWRSLAACQEHDPNLFFPSEEVRYEAIAEAKKVCSACPVVDECLNYALETGQVDGIWGGMTATARRRLRQSLLDDFQRAS